MPLKSNIPIIVSKTTNESSFEIPREKNKINIETIQKFSLNLLKSINN
jgi:hypothetical protein